MFFDLAQETASFSCNALPVLCEKVFSSRPTCLASGRLPVTLVDVHGWSASLAPFRESFSSGVKQTLKPRMHGGRVCVKHRG